MALRIRKLLLGLIIISLVMNVDALASVEVRVNADARAYRSASTDSGSVRVSKGTVLTMVAYSGDWAKVSYRGIAGYMPISALNLTTRIGAYVKRDTNVYGSASTSSPSASVKANTKLYVIGRSGDFYRVQNASGTVTAYIAMSDLSREPSSTSNGIPVSSWKSKVVALDWYKGGSGVLDVGDYGYVYDIRSGITVRIKRMGGTNHADCEPASAADTALLKRIAGGTFSWDSHACILYADGHYVACAINTMPHGDQTIADNGYNGQFCLHMLNSRTHGTDSLNSSHQSSIAAAYLWAVG